MIGTEVALQHGASFSSRSRLYSYEKAEGFESGQGILTDNASSER
jgi:hypothetical protein